MGVADHDGQDIGGDSIPLDVIEVAVRIDKLHNPALKTLTFYNIVLFDVFSGVYMVEKVFAVAKELKVGKYVLIDDIPCRVVNIESSKPGKHGSAKMRITAIGVFNNQKKTLLTPGDADVEVPIIERKTIQIMSVSGNNAQVMDQQSYEIYDMEIPEEFADQIAAGKEAEIIEAMGKRKVERIK